MQIETTRFGPVEVDQSRLIHFPEGLVGFPAHRRFALIATGQQSSFYWLQSVDDPDLAFVVTDPRLFILDYEVHLRAEDYPRVGAEDKQPVQLFVIVNKVDQLLTANLQGPLVVNPANRLALQIVLSEKRYTTRHPLLHLPVRRQTMSRSA
jgi:flagellar assembly factor FliW